MSSFALTVSAKNPGWKVGDSWTYAWSGSEENLTISGTVVMKVAGTTQENVGGTLEDAFLVDIDGNGTACGTVESFSVSAVVTLTGSETRLKSDLSLARSGFNMTMVMSVMGTSMTMSIGTAVRLVPPQKDMPISINLTENASVLSAGTITGTSWMVFLGMNETMPVVEAYQVNLTVKGTDVQVKVPKDTFSCAWITIVDNSVSAGNFYYSEKVGNYVSTSGGSSSLGAISLGDLELTAYKHGGAGVSTMTLMIIGIVAVIVVVAVVLAVVMMRRPKAPAPMMQPQAQAMPPSAPPQGPPQPPPGM